eukprot:2752032-Pleurochrysis_carterae.AAC.1
MHGTVLTIAKQYTIRIKAASIKTNHCVLTAFCNFRIRKCTLRVPSQRAFHRGGARPTMIMRLKVLRRYTRRDKP